MLNKQQKKILSEFYSQYKELKKIKIVSQYNQLYIDIPCKSCYPYETPPHGLFSALDVYNKLNEIVSAGNYGNYPHPEIVYSGIYKMFRLHDHTTVNMNYVIQDIFDEITLKLAVQKKKDEAYTQFATAGALYSSVNLPLEIGAYIGTFFKSRKEGMVLARTCTLAATLAKAAEGNMKDDDNFIKLNI